MSGNNSLSVAEYKVRIHNLQWNASVSHAHGDDAGALKLAEEAILAAEDFYSIDLQDIQNNLVLSTSNPIHVAVAQAEIGAKLASTLRIIDSSFQDIYIDAFRYALSLGSEYRQKALMYLDKAKKVGFVCARPYLMEVYYLMSEDTYDIQRVKRLLNWAFLYIVDIKELSSLYEEWITILDSENQSQLILDLLYIWGDLIDDEDLGYEYNCVRYKIGQYCRCMNLPLDKVLENDEKAAKSRLEAYGVNLELSPYLTAYVNQEIRAYSKCYQSLDIHVYKAAVLLKKKKYIDALGYREEHDKIQLLDESVELDSDQLLLFYKDELEKLLRKQILQGVENLDAIGLLVQPKEVWSLPKFSLIGLVDTDSCTMVKEINSIAHITLDFTDLRMSKFKIVNKRRYLPYLKVIPTFECMDYDTCIEKILEQNKYFMKLFEEDLDNKGVSEKTKSKHMNNIDLYLNSYIAHYKGKSVLTDLSINYFIDIWFMRKCLWSSPSSVKGYITSFKKFFKCLNNHGIIDSGQYALILDEIKENKDEWIAEAKRNY